MRNSSEEIAENIQSIRQKITEVALSCGRKQEDVELLLVSKTVDASRVQYAVDAGENQFGENRVQELLEKKPRLPTTVKWHMIGHLQTNKVKQIINHVVMIHSLDSLALLSEIEKQAVKQNKKEVDCLIQVNSSGEASKFGLAPEVVGEFVQGISLDSPVKICGLMTIGPLTSDEVQVRKAFKRTRALRDDLRKQFPEKKWDILSMGMSGDYKIAIEEGTTMIRVGSAVFGSRA